MAGRLKDQVQLQQRSEVNDAYGDPTVTYTTLETAWAQITPLSLREVFQAQQVQSEITHQITMRYTSTSSTLRAEDRIASGSRVFDLQGQPIDQDGRKQYVTVTAVERT